MGKTTHDEESAVDAARRQTLPTPEAGFTGKIQMFGGEAPAKEMPLFKRLKLY